jgi:hypothetical protein
MEAQRKGEDTMHKRLIVVATVLALAATGTPALAGWGCGAQGKGAQGRTWNFSTRTQASNGALDECNRAGGRHCRLVGCHRNVDTEAQANTFWPPASADTVRCGGAGQPKC